MLATYHIAGYRRTAMERLRAFRRTDDAACLGAERTITVTNSVTSQRQRAADTAGVSNETLGQRPGLIGWF